MASWTDVNPKLTEFTPYRQQLPVEAMVNVGVQKQQQYDQGVQKIQNQIENIAGMDIVRDIDKKYLQSKLNELGNNLKGVAGGDFSNFQLVNSVGGMANRIVKDPHIINAVVSTSRYRKGVEEMNLARKEGKSSPSNEWEYGEQANQWLSSPHLKDTFNGSYTPYTDVSKKWMEVVKSLHSDLQDVDIAYETNPDGSPNYSKTLAAMQRISKESVSSAKIENALRAELSPTELNQLSIDGRYTFRGVDVEQLAHHASSKYQSAVNTNNEAIKQLEGYAKLNASNSENLLRANSSIASLKEQNKSLKNQLDGEVASIYQNPEQAKAEIYKNGAIQEFATAHAWEHDKSNLLDNPVQKSEQWERKFILDKQEFDWKRFKDKHDMAMSEKEYELKFNKARKDLFGATSGFTTFLGVSPNVQDPRTAISNSIKDNLDRANSIKNEIVASSDGKITKTQLENAIEKYRNGDSADLNSVTASIPVELQDEVNQAIRYEVDAKKLDYGLKNVENQVKNSPKFKAREAEIEAELQSLPTLNIEGNQFNQSEISNYLLKRTKAAEAMGSDIGSLHRVDEELGKNLSDKEKVLHEAMRNYSGIKGELNKYSDVTAKYKSTIQEQQDEITKELMIRGGQYVPAVTGINTPTPEAKDAWNTIASDVLYRYANDRGGAEGVSSGDVTKAQDWLTKETKKDITYKIMTQGGKDILVMEKGSDHIELPLTIQEASSLPVINDGPSSDEQKLTTALAMGRNDTNPDDNPMYAHFQKFDLPSVKRLNVVADVSSNKTNPGKNYIRLKLKVGNNWIPLQLSAYPMDKANIINQVNGLTDEQVKKLYMNDPSVSAESKQQIATIN